MTPKWLVAEMEKMNCVFRLLSQRITMNIIHVLNLTEPRLVPPGHLGSLHFFSGPTPFITKSLLKSRVANLQPTKMSQYRLGNPDAHVPPSLNKGARPQKHVIVSSYLGSGGPKVISSF